MYNSNYHIVTWKNIGKTLWILFEHCYIKLLQIDCYIKSNKNIIIPHILQYKNCLEKLWKRISRFNDYSNNNIINNTKYSKIEMNFINILRNKQHQQLIQNIEQMRQKYIPNTSIIIQNKKLMKQ